MSLHDDLLLAIKATPFMTTSQIADKVGESEIKLVSRELGNLSKTNRIVKNGQKLWSVVTDVRGEYVDKYDIKEESKPAVVSLPSQKMRDAVATLCHEIPVEIEAELKNLEHVISRPPLPKALAEVYGIDIELAVLERFIAQFHPEIAAVLEATHKRLVALKVFNEALVA
jgi:hypothetical protein